MDAHIEIRLSFANRYPPIEKIKIITPQLAQEISNSVYTAFQIPCRVEIEVTEKQSTTYTGETQYRLESAEERTILHIAAAIQEKEGTIRAEFLQAESQRAVNLNDTDYEAAINQLMNDGKIYSPRPNHLKLVQLDEVEAKA